MEAHLPVLSTHLFELLRFAEQQHKVQLHYGAPPYSTSLGLILHPKSDVTEGDVIQISNGAEVIAGYQQSHEVHVPHDLDGILLKTTPLPEEVSDQSPSSFVSQVIDVCVQAAMESYRAQVLERKKREYVGYRSRATREQLAALQSTQRNLTEQIYRLDRDLQDTWRRKNDTDTRLRGLEELTVPEVRRNAEGEFDRVWGLVPARFEKVELHDWAVIAVTTPIVIEHDSIGYELGRFKITIPFDLSEHLIVVSVDHPTENTDYPHPHVSTDGTVCWGSLSGAAAECRANGDIFHQIVLVDRLLRSYNGGSPYAEIQRWDPDWEDVDRYERCVEDAVPYSDCIHCSDDCCPYWSSRYERCWENLCDDDLESLERCTACAICERHNQAVDLVSEILTELEEEDAA